MEENIRNILRFIGEDPTREGLKETPERVVRMYKEIFRGYNPECKPKVSIFQNGKDNIRYDEMIIDTGDYYSHCLPGDQFVNSVGRSKRARNIIVGDKLWTLSNGIPVQTIVEKITTHTALKISNIELVNGTKIKVTADHPIKMKDTWVEAGNLKVGDCVEWVNPKTLCKKQYPLNIGFDLGYVLGAVASDCGISGRVGNSIVRLVVRDKWFAEKFKGAIFKAFNFTAKIDEIYHYGQWKGGTYYRVNVCSSQIAKRLLKMLDLNMYVIGSKTKTFHLPKIVLTDETIFSGFLEGYVDGDGHNVKNGRMITTSNKHFAKELASVLDTKVGGERNGTIYKIYVSDHWMEEGWYNKHGFIKQETSLELGESQFIPVKSIKIEEKPTKVYSFKCKENPSFLVGGILTHNCEHHMVPFFGKYWFAYLPSPDGGIIGLSKVARIVDYHAAKLQIQERLVNDIVTDIWNALSENHTPPLGMALIMQGEHLCKTMRGAKKKGMMTTSKMLGVFLDKPEAKAELMQLIRQ